MILPQDITARLQKAGTAAYAIRSHDGVQGPRTSQYHELIKQIDAAQADARQRVPHLYRKEAP